MVDQNILKRYINENESLNRTDFNLRERRQSITPNKAIDGKLELKKFENLQDVLKHDRTIKPLNDISFVQFNNLSL